MKSTNGMSPRYIITVAIIAFVIQTIIGLSFTYYVMTENNKRWCALLVKLDAQYQEHYNELQPAGKSIADEVHSLRHALHC